MQCSRKSLFMLDKYFDYFTATVSDRLQVCGSPHQPECGKNSWLTRPLQSHDLTIHDWLHLHPLVLSSLLPAAYLKALMSFIWSPLPSTSRKVYCIYILSVVLFHLYLLHLIWYPLPPASDLVCLVSTISLTMSALSSTSYPWSSISSTSSIVSVVHRLTRSWAWRCWLFCWRDRQTTA